MERTIYLIHFRHSHVDFVVFVMFRVLNSLDYVELTIKECQSVTTSNHQIKLLVVFT